MNKSGGLCCMVSNFLKVVGVVITWASCQDVSHPPQARNPLACSYIIVFMQLVELSFQSIVNPRILVSWAIGD